MAARWLVFGRKEYSEPLRLEGEVEGESAEAASAHALESRGLDWVELTLVPTSSLSWVLRPSSEEEGTDE